MDGVDSEEERKAGPGRGFLYDAGAGGLAFGRLGKTWESLCAYAL